MSLLKKYGLFLSGAGAGAVAGLFGAGGGMVLVPLLTAITDISDDAVFPASVCIILPICLVSLFLTIQPGADRWKAAVPYLIGGSLGVMMGMRLFRHKTLHPKFSIGVPVILVLQIVMGIILWTI